MAALGAITAAQWVQIAAAVISVGMSIYMSGQVGDTLGNDLGSNVVKYGVEASRNLVYGRSFCSLTNVYNNVSDTSSEYMTQVFSIGGFGTLHRIHQLYIEDKKVMADEDIDLKTDPSNPLDGFYSNKQYPKGVGVTPWPTRGGLTVDFQDQCKIMFRSGHPNEIANELAVKNSDGEWTSEHRGTLTPHVCIVSERNLDSDGIVIMSPRYKIRALVSGIDTVYDPRTQTSGYTANAALCLLDFLTAGHGTTKDTKYYGMAIDPDFIDQTSFIMAANWCDANKIEINAEIETNTTFGEILKNMLTVMDAVLSIENGKICLRYEDITTSKYHFTEDDIIGTVAISDVSTTDYYNSVEVTYKNRMMDDEEDVFTLPKDINSDPRIQADQRVRSNNIDLKYAVDGYIEDQQTSLPKIENTVKFIANRMFYKSYYQKTIKIKIDTIKYPLDLYDVFSVTLPLYGYDNRMFRVMEIDTDLSESGFGTSTITAREYNDGIYTGELDGNAGKPRPEIPSATPPYNLVFDLQSYATSGSGKLTWDSDYNVQGVQYQVEYKLSNSNDWTTLNTVSEKHYYVSALRPDTYDFRVRSRVAWKNASKWAYLRNVSISSTIALPKVTGLTVFSSSDSIDFKWKWNSMLDSVVSTVDPSNPTQTTNRRVSDVFSHYFVTVQHYTNTWVTKGGYTTSTNEFTYTYAENQSNGLARNVRIIVQIVDKNGNQSPASVWSQATNPQMPLTTVTNARGQLQVYEITWNKPQQLDYEATEVHISTSSGFTPSSATRYADISGGSFIYTMPDTTVRYLKIGSFDKFGRDSITYSSQVVLTPVSIDDLLPDEPDKLEDLRDPNVVVTDTGTWIKNVSSANDKKTAGLGLFTDNGKSQFIVAADELIMSVGGHAKWVNTSSYNVGDRCFYGTYPNQGLYQAKIANRNVTPTNTTYWTLVNPNVDQSILYIDGTNETAYIRNAVIKNLTSSNILTHSLTGVELSASSNITVGQGNQVVRLSGTDGTYRLWAGHQSGGSANFSVDKNGVLRATGAIISGSGSFTGSITATSGSFKGAITADSGTLSNVTVNQNCVVKGRLESNDGYFNGEVYVEKLDGDVVSTKIENITSEVSITANGNWQTITSGSFGTSRINRYMIVSGVNLTSELTELAYGGLYRTNPTMFARLVINGQVVNEWFLDLAPVATWQGPSGDIEALMRGSQYCYGARYVAKSGGTWQLQIKQGTTGGRTQLAKLKPQQIICQLTPSGKTF